MVSNADEQLKYAVEESRAIRDKALLPMLNWYRDHRKLPFIVFRTTGVLTILLSVCLPIVALVTFQGQPYVLSAMSALIACLSALSAFYRWEHTWHSRIAAYNSLRHLPAQWELAILRAYTLASSDDRLKAIYDATDDVIAFAAKVVSEESEGFFAKMSFPSAEAARKS